MFLFCRFLQASTEQPEKFENADTLYLRRVKFWPGESAVTDLQSSLYRLR